MKYHKTIMNLSLHYLNKIYKIGFCGCLATVATISIPIAAKLGIFGTNRVEFNDAPFLHYYPKIGKNLLHTYVYSVILEDGQKAHIGEFSKLYFRPVKVYHNGKEVE